MNYSLVLCLLFITFANSISLQSLGIQYKKCDCKVFLNQSDCEENCYGDWCIDSNCIWDGQICQNPKCSQLTAQKSCDIFPNCYFNAKGICEDFLNCSQLDSKINNCYGQNCYPPDSTTTNTQCLSAPAKPQKICSQILNQQDCNASQEKLLNCLWYNSKCVKINCGLLNTKSDCNILSFACKFSNNACLPLTCEDFTTEEDCKLLLDLVSSDGMQCMFIDNKCVNPQVSQLTTQDLCSLGTLDTYAFINGTCQQCELWKYINSPSTNTQNGNGTTNGNGTVNGTTNGNQTSSANGTDTTNITGTQTKNTTGTGAGTGNTTGTGNSSANQTNQGTEADSEEKKDSSTSKYGTKLLAIIGNIVFLFEIKDKLEFKNMLLHKLKPQIIKIYFDKVQIQQKFLNILRNSQKNYQFKQNQFQ
ncbi:hypothetical protein pb186bvf_006949 [Paramecium bursaria]